jgi:hypothetical protein
MKVRMCKSANFYGYAMYTVPKDSADFLSDGESSWWNLINPSSHGLFPPRHVTASGSIWLAVQVTDHLGSDKQSPYGGGGV